MIGRTNAGSGGAGGKAAIGVTYPAGSTCKCVFHGTTQTLNAPSNQTSALFGLPKEGTWDVTISDSANNKTATRSVTLELHEAIELHLNYIAEFPVDWSNGASFINTFGTLNSTLYNQPLPLSKDESGQYIKFQNAPDEYSGANAATYGFIQTMTPVDFTNIKRLNASYARIYPNGACIFISRNPLYTYTFDFTSTSGKITDLVYVNGSGTWGGTNANKTLLSNYGISVFALPANGNATPITRTLDVSTLNGDYYVSLLVAGIAGSVGYYGSQIWDINFES